MSSGNQNWRFSLTSSLLGNWDRQLIFTCMTLGNHNWRFYLTSSFAGQLGHAIPSHLHVLREPELEDFFDLKLAEQLGQA
jgi:hypothetical protein